MEEKNTAVYYDYMSLQKYIYKIRKIMKTC